MHDEFGAVHQHPFAGAFALNREHLTAGRFHLVADVTCQRLGLPRALSGGNDERVINGRQRTGVEHGDVTGLDVFKGGDGGFLDVRAL